MKVKSNDVGTCPRCDGANLDYDAVRFEGDMCYFPWHCKECGQDGEEWYEMTFMGHNVLTEDGMVEIENDMIGEESEE